MQVAEAAGWGVPGGLGGGGWHVREEGGECVWRAVLRQAAAAAESSARGARRSAGRRRLECASSSGKAPGLPLKQTQRTVKLEANVFLTEDRGRGCVLGVLRAVRKRSFLVSERVPLGFPRIQLGNQDSCGFGGPSLQKVILSDTRDCWPRALHPGRSSQRCRLRTRAADPRASPRKARDLAPALAGDAGTCICTYVFRQELSQPCVACPAARTPEAQARQLPPIRPLGAYRSPTPCRRTCSCWGLRRDTPAARCPASPHGSASEMLSSHVLVKEETFSKARQRQVA